MKQIAKVLFAAILTLSFGAAAKGEEKKLTYDDLLKIAKSLLDKGELRVQYPELSLSLSDKGNRVVVRRAQFQLDTPFLTKFPENERYLMCLQSIVEHDLYLLIYGDYEPMKEALKKEGEINKKLVTIANSNKKHEDKLEEMQKLQASANDELEKIILERIAKLGLKGVYNSERTMLAATLVTDPPGGKICLLSVLEYELFKHRGLDADAMLAECVVAKVDPAFLSGHYYYMVSWANGNKTKPQKFHVNSDGTYTLK